MKSPTNNISILMADDDLDDRTFAAEAITESRIDGHLDFVTDGEQLLDYLRRRGQFRNLEGDRLPDLILLDLNMPRMDGREALNAIRADPALRHLPVVILTTSKSDDDVFNSYDIGANSYVIKPSSYEDLVQLMKDIGRYWFRIVELPLDSPTHRQTV